MTAFALSAAGDDLVGTGTLTLSAGVAQHIDLDMAGRSKCSLLVRNTGVSNALDSVAVSGSPAGTLFATYAAYGTAIGSTATSTTAPGITIAEGPLKTLRITFASTSGTTIALEVRAR